MLPKIRTIRFFSNSRRPRAMCDVGVGEFLRASTVTRAGIRAAVERVMHEESFTRTAHRVAASFAGFDPHARFRAVIDEVTAHGGTANGTIRSTGVAP
jgi:UDP:flavonoid glycosyltransferase YjiC (YdhE family)